MKSNAPKFLFVAACGIAASLLLFRALAAEPEYELAQPLSVTVAGQEVKLPAGQAVTVIGSPNGSGNVMIKVTLSDGSVSMTQIPQTDLRVKGAAGAPAAATAGAPPEGAAPAPVPAAVSAPAPAPQVAQATQPATSTAPAPVAGASGAISVNNSEGGGGGGEHTGWKLVWEDDFSKDDQILRDKLTKGLIKQEQYDALKGKPDPDKWSFQINGNGGGNGEQEYYTDSLANAIIKDGVLVMTAIKGDQGKKFTSAKIWTKGKYELEYGRIEACIKAPKSQKGNWPAFWMMPHEPSPYGGWPNCGEIDIMEVINMEDTLYGTDHFGIGGQGGVKIKAADGDFSKDYHVYGVEWEKDKFTWFLDHKSYGSITKWGSKGAPFPAPFDQKFYIILNYAVGGQWPKNPDATSTFPQSMSVKYVRVYQP